MNGITANLFCEHFFWNAVNAKIPV